MKKFLLTLLLLILATAGNAAGYQLMHEAFVEPVRDLTPQEIISKSPPEPKQEVRPNQPEEKMIWIPGYWHWVSEAQDFVWVCGVWRVPPPQHSWLTGRWLKMNMGWIWVRGAWLAAKNHTVSNVVSSKNPPPPIQNEDTGNPAPAENFWCMGYWELKKDADAFEWRGGSWRKFDPQWIFIPSHWIWRPEGYLFIPAYWDWRLEYRGASYSCEDQSPLSPKDIVEILVLSYPDYAAECCFYQYYQPLFWTDCDCLPPWWSWNDWWSIPWSESWWLWWWYSHPEYPCPPFIKPLVDLLPPPTEALTAKLGLFPAPIFVTTFGVPSLDLWVQAIKNVIGGTPSAKPLLPPVNIGAILANLQKLMPETSKVRPGGKASGSRLQKPYDPNAAKSRIKAIVPPTPDQLTKKGKPTHQIFNIPPIEFVSEPAYNPTLKVYPSPAFRPHDYRREEYNPWFQNYDNEGRRRGAHHKHHDHDGGGGHHSGGKGPKK